MAITIAAMTATMRSQTTLLKLSYSNRIVDREKMSVFLVCIEYAVRQVRICVFDIFGINIGRVFDVFCVDKIIGHDL